MKIKLLCFYLFCLCLSLKGQQLFYSNILRGGITGNGGSAGVGSGTINFVVQIPSGSTIKKAYLIAARDSLANDITVTLNGINYTFTNNSIVTSGFNAGHNNSINKPSSSMHAIDITDDINPNINNYSLTIPPQWPQTPPNSGIYSLIYFVIVYEKPTLPFVCVNIFLNKTDVMPITNYHLSFLNPINNLFPVGLEVNTSYFCDTTEDGSYVQVNADTIGLLGGDDFNSQGWACGGPWANFSYYNQTIFGLEDDTPDNYMNGTDATADIKSYVNNNDTAIDLFFKYQSNFEPLTNPIRSVILSYTTPCDTFSVKLLTKDTTICRGNTVQLGVSGGNTTLAKPAYEWLPQKDLSCYNCPNPVFSGDSSQVYTVRIWNTDSCSKVLPVRVKVLPLPKFGQITTQNTVCGVSTGFISTSSTGSLAGDSLFMDNLFVGFTPHTQSNLGGGNYTLYLTDTNGCSSADTSVTINTSNNTEALFALNPQTGAAPLNVATDNQSTHATDYLWYFQNNSSTAFAPHFSFDTSGTYNITLVAYQNDIACADTFSLQVVVYDSLQIIIPNVFTPNGDGQNDVFSIQVNAPCSGNINIVNRWGNVVFSKDFSADGKTKIQLWNGKTKGEQVADGVYFYYIKLTSPAAEPFKTQGFVHVVR